MTPKHKPEKTDYLVIWRMYIGNIGPQIDFPLTESSAKKRVIELKKAAELLQVRFSLEPNIYEGRPTK